MNKFLWLVLVLNISAIFGQSFHNGTVYNSSKKQEKLFEIINNSLKPKNEVSSIKDVFQVFNDKSPICDQHVNLLFCNNSLYINRFFPIHRKYECINVLGNVYHSVQIPDLLGFKREEIIALNIVKENINVIKVSVEKDYFSVKDAWEHIKNIRNEEKRTLIINEIIDKEKYNWLIPYYQKLHDFINAVYILGYDVSDKQFTIEILSNIYSYAQMHCQKYINAFASYISFFNTENGDSFRRKFEKVENKLLNLKKICSLNEFARYAHTEYMLKFAIFRKGQQIDKNIFFISYYDMCDNCEELWANIANENIVVNVASLIPYRNSRNKKRENCNPNLELVFEDKT